VAVAQEFIDLFIPIKEIERVYPEGWNAYLDKFAEDLGHSIWHDDYLLREGAMSADDIAKAIQWWAELGVETHRTEGGRPVEWLGLCVSQGILGGPTLPCPWIAYDEETGGAFLKGTAPGVLAWPERRADSPGTDDWIANPTFKAE